MGERQDDVGERTAPRLEAEPEPQSCGFGQVDVSTRSAAPVDPAVATPSSAATPSGLVLPVPTNWEGLLTRRHGYRYLVIPVDWSAQPGRRLGITLSYHARDVVVSGLALGSLGFDCFDLLDRIVAVNGIRVVNEIHAKQLMLNSRGRFQALVERPETTEAHQSIVPPNAVPGEPPRRRVRDARDIDPRLPPDAIAISGLQRARHRLTAAHSNYRPILRRPAPTATSPTAGSLSATTQHSGSSGSALGTPSGGGRHVSGLGNPATTHHIPNDVPPETVLHHIPPRPDAGPLPVGPRFAA